jgi:hypothetical protein
VRAVIALYADDRPMHDVMAAGAHLVRAGLPAV